MAGDFNKPALEDTYTLFASSVRDLCADISKGLDPALSLGTTNIPTNAIRWSSASGYWEKYNGAVWSQLATTYAINVNTANAWSTGRTITLTSDVTGTSGAWTGSGNISFATTLASVITAAGPIGSATSVPIVTVDAKGRVTALSSASIGTMAAQSAVTFSIGNAGSAATLDLSNTSSVLKIPQSTTQAPTAEGSIGWDTNNDVLVIGDGAGTKVISPDNITATLYNKTLDATCVFPTLNQNTTGSSGSCTGNAATASNAQLLDGVDGIYFPQGTGYLSAYTAAGRGGHNPDTVFASFDSNFIDVWAAGGTYPPGCSHVHGFQTRHDTGTGYGMQVVSQYSIDGLFFRKKNAGVWTAWRTLIHDGNIGSQSVSSAATVTSAAQPNITSTGAVLSSATSMNSPDFYASGWFRNSAAKTGFYNSGYGNHFYAESANSWVASFAGSSWGAVTLRQNHDAALKGQFYWDSSGVGLLNDLGGWGVRLNYGASYGGQLYGAWSATGTLSATNLSGTNTGDQTNISGNAASATTAASCSGNAASATIASTATIYTNRTDAAFYQVMWTTSGSTTLYSSAASGISIRSSAYGAIGFNSAAWYIEGNATYGLYTNTGFYAAGGLWDSGNRVYSAANLQGSVSGSSGSCTGQAENSMKFMSTSHNGTYWTVNNWDGTYWYQTTNHGSPVRVGRADSAATSEACSGTSTYANNCAGWFYFNNNYGHSVEGIYNSTLFQGLYGMGPAYRLGAGGTVGNLYGMTWSYPSAGGAAGNLASHGFIVLINGGFASSMSSNIVASGNITAYSDDRLKENWRPMPENYLQKLAKVRVGIYDRIDLHETQVGVSAQSLEPVLPPAVTTSNDDMKTKHVSYGNAALASAVMLAQETVELRRMIEQLQQEVNILKGKQ